MQVGATQPVLASLVAAVSKTVTGRVDLFGCDLIKNNGGSFLTSLEQTFGVNFAGAHFLRYP